MPYIFGKLWHLAIIWAIRKAFQCILQGVRILLAKYTRISPTSENESYQDGAFGGHQMGGGEFGASARWATKDLLRIFVFVVCLFSLSMWKVKVVLSLFTFYVESESSFASTSWVISGIIFSSWKGRWAESTRKCGVDQFRNIGWKRKPLEWIFFSMCRLSQKSAWWKFSISF